MIGTHNVDFDTVQPPKGDKASDRTALAQCASLLLQKAAFPAQSAAAVVGDDGQIAILELRIDGQEVASPQDYEFARARTREELLEMWRERLAPRGRTA